MVVIRVVTSDLLDDVAHRREVRGVVTINLDDRITLADSSLPRGPGTTTVSRRRILGRTIHGSRLRNTLRRADFCRQIDVGIGEPPRDGHEVHHDDADQQVHHDAPQQDDEALPHGPFDHGKWLVFWSNLIDRCHPGDIAKPTEGDSFEAIFRHEGTPGRCRRFLFPPSEREKRRAKANKVTTDTHSAGACRNHVATFMQRDGQNDPQGE